MADIEISEFSGGASQHQLRNHNERLILTLIQRHDALPGSDIARRAGLSPQTVSVILRRLEGDGLIHRRDPQRGRVGKPSVPMALAPRGVLSFGLKIGRRSADLVLVDFSGAPIAERRTTFAYPTPDLIFTFLRREMDELTEALDPAERDRLAGIGIATPYQLWHWHDLVGGPQDQMNAWQNVSIIEEISAFTDLPVFVQNDATAACRAEHIYGHGKAFRDYAYFFIGSFIGGGVVLNHTVFDGHQGNAGAFGSLPMQSAEGTRQLIDTASIYLLEAALDRAGHEPAQLWTVPLDWNGFPDVLDRWIEDVADQLSRAALTVCAVIDFQAVVIDGAMPSDVRSRIVDKAEEKLSLLDTRGLIPPRIEAGVIGPRARGLGAACAPIFSQYLLDTHAGLAAP